MTERHRVARREDFFSYKCWFRCCGCRVRKTDKWACLAPLLYVGLKLRKEPGLETRSWKIIKTVKIESLKINGTSGEQSSTKLKIQTFWKSFKKTFYMNLLGWHRLIKLYRFQVYGFITHHLYIVLCVHHPKASLLEHSLDVLSHITDGRGFMNLRRHRREGEN